MSLRPAISRSRRALGRVRSSGTLPATGVIASTCSSGDRSASRIARASSTPGSVSMMTRRGAPLAWVSALLAGEPAGASRAPAVHPAALISQRRFSESSSLTFFCPALCDVRVDQHAPPCNTPPPFARVPVNRLTLSRRSFVAAALATGLPAAARSGHPVGVQLYTVRKIVLEHPAETLRAIAAMGYREVEVLRDQLVVLAPHLKATGLRAVAMHFETPILTGNWDAWKHAEMPPIKPA